MLDAATIPRIASTTDLEAPQNPQCGRYPAGADQERSGWACVHTHPQAERWAQAQLTRIGYVTYLPLHAIRRRDRVTQTLTRIVLVPIWTRYLFVRINQADPWTPIRYAPGVHSLLMTNGKPHTANAGDIRALQAAQAISQEIPQPDAPWRPGALCSLATGCALEGLTAVITAVHSSTATIAMLFLGELRTLTVPIDALVPTAGD